MLVNKIRSNLLSEIDKELSLKSKFNHSLVNGLTLKEFKSQHKVTIQFENPFYYYCHKDYKHKNIKRISYNKIKNSKAKQNLIIKIKPIEDKHQKSSFINFNNRYSLASKKLIHFNSNHNIDNLNIIKQCSIKGKSKLINKLPTFKVNLKFLTNEEKELQNFQLHYNLLSQIANHIKNSKEGSYPTMKKINTNNIIEVKNMVNKYIKELINTNQTQFDLNFISVSKLQEDILTILKYKGLKFDNIEFKVDGNPYPRRNNSFSYSSGNIKDTDLALEKQKSVDDSTHLLLHKLKSQTLFFNKQNQVIDINDCSFSIISEEYKNSIVINELESELNYSSSHCSD